MNEQRDNFEKLKYHRYFLTVYSQHRDINLNS